ncbi:hypothetical protein AVEN_237188-1 [Araneus ventricosus]|uniref:Uncharacterized protein n=1 Tax=Araneus ventricosus TaxID=182803 RepID=A0A4Y2HYS1_ARAVE|nr:hypothetical protein AVEN_237188-1 [Araneus ventricosus]
MSTQKNCLETASSTPALIFHVVFFPVYYQFVMRRPTGHHINHGTDVMGADLFGLFDLHIFLSVPCRLERFPLPTQIKNTFESSYALGFRYTR